MSDCNEPLSASPGQIASLIDGLLAVEALIRESRGVVGLHLNGDIAPWGDLLAGGRFEEWLLEFDDALAIAKRLRG